MPRLTRAQFATLSAKPRARSRVALGLLFRPAFLDVDLRLYPFPVASSDATAWFVVPGDPVSKARPRLGHDRSGKPHIYTPNVTTEWERRVRDRYVVGARQHVTTADRLGVRLRFHCSTRFHRDADNLYKCVTDALNGVAYPDDEQIDQAYADVERGVADEDACVEILIYRLHRPMPPEPQATTLDGPR